MPINTRAVVFAALAFCVLAPLAYAGGAALPGRSDGPQGTEHFPPPRPFDHLHMRLTLDIPDMQSRRLSGELLLTVTPIGKARQALELDAGPDLAISSVDVGVVDGPRPAELSKPVPASFKRSGSKLSVTLPAPVPLGQVLGVRIRYVGEFVKADGTGLTWTLGKPDATSPTDVAPQIHSQGQPQFNHLWFPLHDFPNERMSSELIVTVEDGFVVCSNGRLVSSRLAVGAPASNGRPRTTWHWLQTQPHAGYLVSMVIGKFAIVGLPPGEGEPVRNAAGEVVPLTLYAPLGTEERAARNYAATGPMIRFFAEWFDEPYPWDKYAQTLVRSFFAGGMENTSATTMRAESATARPGSQDEIIAHELAHQWTGDLLTCKSWEHGWLNEGWASYGEALWQEHAAQPPQRQRAYQRSIAQFLGVQRGLNRTYAPAFPPLVSRRYNEPLEVFMKPNDIYAKGAIVLHMLRMKLGDEIFQRGVRLYIDRFKFKEVETDDFRQVLEEVSGLSLEQFFHQWCDRPGLPRLSAELEWTPGPSQGPNEGGGTLKVKVSQTQRIDQFNPAYAFELPIDLKLPGNARETVTMRVDAKDQESSFTLRAKPVDVVFDPRLSIAAPTAVRKPLAMWMEQLGHESVFAQLDAIDELGKRVAQDDPDRAAILAALTRIAADPNAPDVLRDSAAVRVAGGVWTGARAWLAETLMGMPRIALAR